MTEIQQTNYQFGFGFSIDMVDDSLMIWCFQQKYADIEIFGDMTLIVAYLQTRQYSSASLWIWVLVDLLVFLVGGWGYLTWYKYIYSWFLVDHGIFTKEISSSITSRKILAHEISQ